MPFPLLMVAHGSSILTHPGPLPSVPLNPSPDITPLVRSPLTARVLENPMKVLGPHFLTSPLSNIIRTLDLPVSPSDEISWLMVRVRPLDVALLSLAPDELLPEESLLEELLLEAVFLLAVLPASRPRSMQLLHR